MIKLISGHERFRYPQQMDAMHRLRARVFADRLAWSVKVENGWEVDEFDKLDPLYLVSEGTDGKIRGTVRLLPTTGPNMLSDVFPELLPANQSVRSPRIWESSRFSVNHEALAERSDKLINRATAELLCGMTEVGMRAGLDFIVSVVDVHMERVLKRANCHCERLGDPKKIGKVTTIAGLWEIGDELLSNLREASGIEGSVVYEEDLQRVDLAA
jgi:N-acyl-L-homoserine lactone synthetase